MLEILVHGWFIEGALLSEKSCRGKRNSNVVCKSLGRGGSTAVGESMIHSRRVSGRRRARYKISILNKISISVLQYPNAVCSC